uniref:Germin-like protein n=1 Tax=Fagus sylvatica TaxID=28930 RepID=A0A2N9FWS3_FAGSY
MKSSNSPFYLLSCLIVLVLLPVPSRSADPDSLQDFCIADLNASHISEWLPLQTCLKRLNTLGAAMNRVDYAPGGINPPHSHPRATESGVVIQGQLLVGFVTTQNVFYSKVLSVGEMFVIPKGLVHFQKNVGKGKALAFTAFNSHLPGVVLSTSLFTSQPSIPNDVLTQTFQVDDAVVNAIKSKFGS